MKKKIESVPVGPVRIPKSYKEGLALLLVGKDHITYSDLIREAIYLLLVKRGIIEAEEEYGID
jgi:Arc/MetJ-type ribon-helix-helix transcriptional regulator